MYVCMYVCMYVYVYIWRRELKRAVAQTNETHKSHSHARMDK